jgi:hypothetical protein
LRDRGSGAIFVGVNGSDLLDDVKPKPEPGSESRLAQGWTAEAARVAAELDAQGIQHHFVPNSAPKSSPKASPARERTPATRPREAKSRRASRDRSPPSGDDDPSPRPAPRLLVELPLEGEPTVRLLAETAEDAERLLGWLLRSRALRQLGLQLYDVLDELERSRS